MDSRPVQGKDAEGPDHPGKVQHLSLRGSQGEGDRSAKTRHARQRRDHENRRGDADGKAVKLPIYPVWTRLLPPAGTAPFAMNCDATAMRDHLLTKVSRPWL